MAVTSKTGEWAAFPDEAKGTTSIDFRSILAKLAEELKPGGSIEKSYLADINKEGKQLGAQLEAGAVSRGLGNTRTGIPTTVFNKVSSAKQKLRSDMTSQYMGVLQNLASLALQQEQTDANRAAANRTPTGYSQAGTKLTDFGFGANPMASSFPTSKQPSAAATPSLYAAGGYNAGGQTTDAYTSLTSPLFGGPGASEKITWDYSLLNNSLPLKGYGQLTSGSKVGTPFKESWES